MEHLELPAGIAMAQTGEHFVVGDNGNSDGAVFLGVFGKSCDDPSVPPEKEREDVGVNQRRLHDPGGARMPPCVAPATRLQGKRMPPPACPTRIPQSS